MKKNIFLIFLFLILFCNFPLFSDEKEQIISITQTPCQFLELEGKNYQFQSSSSNDCEVANQSTKAKRVLELKPLRLKEGKYTFRVKNSGVPYEVGFYLRGNGFWEYLSKSSVSGGGLWNGITKDYPIFLKKGNYLLSCPLNPTLDYPLVVE